MMTYFVPQADSRLKLGELDQAKVVLVLKDHGTSIDVYRLGRFVANVPLDGHRVVGRREMNILSAAAVREEV